MAPVAQAERFYRRGRILFRRLERRLKVKHRGEVVAIEPTSGSYVLGKDALEVALKAKEQFRGRPVDFFRIGFPAVHKFRPLPS
jgi:hypothetical protein